MQSGDQDGGTAKTEDNKDPDHKMKKAGRTPLKQPQFSRSSLPSPPRTPLRRKRRRLGGKRTVRSCSSCRAAHVRCVADRYGVPCERCAKKSWLDCTLIEKQQGEAPAKSDTIDLEEDDASESRDLKQVAADALALMREESKPESP